MSEFNNSLLFNNADVFGIHRFNRVNVSAGGSTPFLFELLDNDGTLLTDNDGTQLIDNV